MKMAIIEDGIRKFISQKLYHFAEKLYLHLAFASYAEALLTDKEQSISIEERMTYCEKALELMVKSSP